MDVNRWINRKVGPSLIDGFKPLCIALLWVIASSNALDGCFTGQFTFGTWSTCTESNCPGSCVGDYKCCADDCFSINNLNAQSACRLGYVAENETNEIKCRNTLEEIDCVANISRSTFDICLHQVADLVERGAATIGGVDPVNCPCNDSYIKIRGTCTLDCEANRCYNTTDIWTNTAACCINNNILPINSDCETGEERITSVISMTYDICQQQCSHTCRQSRFGRLSVCCKSIVVPEVDSQSSSGVSGGIIALIVIMVIVLLAVLAVATVWYFRKRATSTDNDII